MSIDRTMMGRMLLTEGDLVSKLAGCLAEQQQQQQQQSKDVKQQSSSSRVQLSRCMLLQSLNSKCSETSERKPNEAGNDNTA